MRTRMLRVWACGCPCVCPGACGETYACAHALAVISLEELRAALPSWSEQQVRALLAEQPSDESLKILGTSDCVESSSYFKMRIVCLVPEADRELCGHEVARHRRAADGRVY